MSRVGPRVSASERLRTPAKRPAPAPGRPTAAGLARHERPSRLALLWRRQRRLLRPAGWTVLALLLLVGVGSLVRTVQPGSTVANWREKVGAAIGLQVQQVVIEGREKTPEPLLRAALGVSRGDRLLGFSLDAARARIEQLAWVQSATVERRLPGAIVVTLQERRPFAVWQSSGKFVLIDRLGQVVAEQDPVKDATAFSTLPLVVGPGAPEAAAALLDTLATFPLLKSRVAAAVRVGERRWNLRLSNGADVLLPEGAEAAAMARLMEMQATQALLDRPLATVDMRLADRLVIRPAPEPKPASTQRRPT
jgi:cell division protein FtsQ